MGELLRSEMESLKADALMLYSLLYTSLGCGSYAFSSKDGRHMEDLWCARLQREKNLSGD